MTTVTGLTEVVIWVRDLERSLAFYRDTLGMPVLAGPDKRGALFLRIGPDADPPQQLVLIPLPDDAEGPPAERTARALHHIGVQIPDADYDAERERLENLGFEVRTGQHPFLPLRGLYIDDPDGNEVELIAGTG